MGQLPSIKSLSIEDFPEQRGWIAKLTDPLNKFMGEIYTLVNKNITLNDNVNSFVHVTDVIGGNFPIYITNLLKNKPLAVIIGNIYLKSSYNTTIGQAITVEWNVSGDGKIQIKNVSGLTSGLKYTITFIIFGG